MKKKRRISLKVKIGKKNKVFMKNLKNRVKVNLRKNCHHLIKLHHFQVKTVEIIKVVVQ